MTNCHEINTSLTDPLDDDSDEDALPYADGGIAPALSDVDDESSFSVEKIAGDLAQSTTPVVQAEPIVGDEFVVPDVDVETETDDESEEGVLSFVDGEIAPALSGSEDDRKDEELEAITDREQSNSDDLDTRLDSFFDDDVPSAEQVADDNLTDDVPVLNSEDIEVEESLDILDLDAEPDRPKEEKEKEVEDEYEDMAPALDFNHQDEENNVSEFSETEDESIQKVFEETTDEVIESNQQESFDIDIQPSIEDVENDTEQVDIDSVSIEEDGEVVTSENLNEEIVFEVVADDVEVDLLLGEEHAAEISDDSFDTNVEENVPFEEEVNTVDYTRIKETIDGLQQQITNDTVQAYFYEINQLRSLAEMDSTNKTFLQLLSTVGQHLEKNCFEPDPAALLLVDEMYSALEKSAEASFDQISQQLYSCTSQVLFLLQEEREVATVQSSEGEDDTQSNIIDDVNLQSYIENGLQTMRQYVDDEIAQLRRELSQ